ncbi:MAG: acyltransferase [Provencibacterium sp.]|nr:acyltransferase [Provencibacterium sp.]
MKRNRAIDYEKGLIVALMVFCHTLQFFGRTDRYPEQYWIITIICSLAFPTFLFAYGRSVWLAYYQRPLKQAAPRMLLSSARAYGAYCISGVAHHLLCSGKEFSSDTLLRVISLRDVPGMSEFLAAFAVLGLVALALFLPLHTLLERKILFWALTLACFAGAFIPYERISSTHLGLLIGTTRFYAFPVLQYFPFFLAGLYMGKYGMERRALWLGGSGLLTAAGVLYFAAYGEPGRFPPALWWLVLPCLLIVLLDLGAGELDRAGQQRLKVRRLLTPIESLGRNSLYYLVTSNLVLFSLSRTGTLPRFQRSEIFPFTLKKGSTPWALFWTLLMLLCIAFVASLYRRGRKAAAEESDNRSKL